MNETNDRWIKLAEWRGETVQALKDIRDELRDLKDCRRQDNKDLRQQFNRIMDKFDSTILSVRKDIDRTDNKLDSLYFKVGFIAGTIGLISTILTHIVTGLI